MTFEKNLKSYRKAAKLSQEKMAELLNVSRQAVTKWETGTGTPDISNLIAISNLFHISLDDLLAIQSPTQTPDFLYQSYISYDIAELKHFDIRLGGAHHLHLQIVDSEKVEIKLASNSLQQLDKILKFKIDDSRSKLDLELNRLDDLTEARAKKELSIFITLPQKYLRDVEIAVNCPQVELNNLVIEQLELDGKVEQVIINGGQGELEINSNLDMLVNIISFTGTVALNQISATSRLQVPADYDFKTKQKGLANKILFEEEQDIAENCSNPDTENIIELNGMKSELLIIPYK